MTLLLGMRQKVENLEAAGMEAVESNSVTSKKQAEVAKMREPRQPRPRTCVAGRTD